jgi:hypothetical protein
MVTDAEFGKEDHNLIYAIAIRRELEPLESMIDPEPD